MTPPAPPPPPVPRGPTRVLKASSPEDLLAAVPIVLGFEPTDSVVLMTFGGPSCFHARIDLPSDPREVEQLCTVLLDPARRHRVPAAAFVLYTEDAALGRRVARRLDRAFGRAGIDVLALLRADGRRWWIAGGPSRRTPDHGVPYDVGTHPFRVQAVVDGLVTHASRADLAATLDPDPARVQRVADALPGAAVLDAAGVSATCASRTGSATGFSDAELAGVALAVQRPEVRDGAWVPMERAAGAEQVRLWSDALRRTPPELVGSVAAVLAFAAWLAGQGALAWCAVDRAVDVDPDNTLAALVADLLSGAVSPSSWSPPLLAG